ncbi:hypothetical protein E4U59_000924 [Claviceps monticola]|nr:hypothetical protein E4U59_000924 [Claviceps monticola]
MGDTLYDLHIRISGFRSFTSGSDEEGRRRRHEAATNPDTVALSGHPASFGTTEFSMLAEPPGSSTRGNRVVSKSSDEFTQEPLCRPIWAQP